MIRLTEGRFTNDLDGFKPNATLNSAVSHNFQSSAFVRYILRDDVRAIQVERAALFGWWYSLNSASLSLRGIAMERSIAERNVDTKLSEAEFTCAPPAQGNIIRNS